MSDDSSNPPATPTPTRVVEWAVNLDDVAGELVAAATEALMREGALDVWTTPIQMKKQRPGVMLSVLCDEASSTTTGRRLLELTGSFGARCRPWDRLVLDRRFVELTTADGKFTAKVGSLDGQLVCVAPEYDSVCQLAEETGRDVRPVMAEAQAAVEAWRQTQIDAGGRDA